MKHNVFLSSFFLSTFLFISVLSFSQAKINGTVTDENGDLLEGATLQVKGTSASTVADSKGRYTLSSEQKFPWTILVGHTSYQGKEFSISKQGVHDFSLTEIVSLGGVTLVGTRGKARTDVNRPVPVDIFSAKELQSTGQTELGQQLQFASPSYNSAKYGINGSLVYADYATLRGLGPDQLLVLINGKRRHQFSIPHIGFSISRGMVVTDMNAIPSLAIERSEILRDGAASQYGSDAIAGIVNLRLRETVNQGIAKTQIGTTTEGDGTNYLVGLNYGFKLGKERSFLNFTLNYQKLGETNRSDPYTGTIYSATKNVDDSLRAARGFYPATAPFKIGVFGASNVKSPQFFINAGYPINDKWAVYSFGGYSYKKAIGYGFFRNAIPSNANSNTALFPDGYVPVFPAEDKDYSTVLGVTRTVLNGWNMDFSTGYGKNAVDRFANTTSNASMGAASPTEFYVGFSSFSQSTTEANFSKNFEGLWKMKALNLAFGSQLRVDKYILKKGEEAAYKIGPLAASQNKTPGVQGIAGTAPEDEASESRSNFGIYTDVEADITESFLLATALRFENYSDFGSNFSGKLASRFNFSNNIAIRGSINKGFRAPSLQQIFNSATTTTVQAGTIRYTKQFPSNNPILDSIGIENPKPEISWNYNIGLAVKAGQKFLFTVDAYQIDITDKIVISEALTVANIAALKNRLVGTGIQVVSFFTNHVKTQTRGIDFVTTYKTSIGMKSKLDASLAMTFNKTKIQDIKKTPDQLQAGTTAKIAIIDTINIALIETAQPRQKIIFSVNYGVGKFNFVGRASHFGSVTAWEKPANLPHKKQDFGAKTLLDASVGFNITPKLLLTVGSNNITNVYPDKVLPTLSAYATGQSPYNRNVNQFGFAGAFYYGSLTLKF
ncbi:MAG: TonB-dependent receptor [Ferruginibacter sp.]